MKKFRQNGKQVKIKRYKNNFTSSSTKAFIKKVFMIAIVLLILFISGYFIGVFINDALIKSKAPVKLPNSSSDTNIDVNSQANFKLPEKEKQENSMPEIEKNSVWEDVNILDLQNMDTAIAKASELQAKSVTHAKIILKDVNGNLYFDTQNPQAQGAKLNVINDLPKIIEVFNKKGITLVASIVAFQDSWAVYNINRDMCVKFASDASVMWLDNSPDLGGKPWLNPYNEEAQGYISAILQEVFDLGFKEVVIEKLHFPQGYALELIGYGNEEIETSKNQELKKFIEELYNMSKQSASVLWIEIPALALAGIDKSGYGEEPYNLQIPNMFVDVALSYEIDGSVTSRGVTKETLLSIEQNALKNNTINLGITVSNSSYDTIQAEQFYNNAPTGFSQKLYG